MMGMNVRLITLALLGSLSMGAMAQDPSLHEVYQAAEHGQLAEAQQMMAKVLKDHPGSAKAHYVEAELLVRQGQYSQAKSELAQAERLQPGLPFAQPSAVSALRAKLSAPPVQSAWQGAPVPSQAPVPHVPLGLIIGVLALLGLGLLWFRSRQRQQPVAVYGGPAMPLDRPYGVSGGAYGGPGNGAYGATPYPGAPMPGTGGGLGSQVLGGLATGAAVGAGVVAGEALMHRFMGNDERRDVTGLQNEDLTRGREVQPDPAYDMGGEDFGLQDTGSWDDGGGASGGGSDDWS